MILIKVDYVIHEPIWANSSFSIAEFRLGKKKNFIVSISYTNKDGQRMYPKPFKISREQFLMAPVIYIKGLKMRNFKLNDLKV